MDGSLGEAVTRAAAEELFPGKKFAKTRRPPWLGGLELDCYCEELRLALEYQGVQHYEYVPHFHRGGLGDLAKQQERDRRKADLCAEHWVSLICVPHTTPVDKIRYFVRRAVTDLGYAEPLATPDLTDDEFLCQAIRAGEGASRMLERAREIAASHNGECLSELYIDCHAPLTFLCHKGHEFQAPLEAVNQPSYRGTRFCPECGGTRAKTTEELTDATAACGYTLLELNKRRSATGRSRRYLRVRCPSGHEFETIIDNFLPIADGKPRKGCIRCARTRTNRGRAAVEREKRLKTFGLEALSPYTIRHESAKWRCLAIGHEFDASWHTIVTRKGTKCLLCKRGA